MIRRETLPVLGTLLDGDLTTLSVRAGRGPVGRRWLATLPWSALTQHTLIIGSTGTGKTITMMRIISSALAAARANGQILRVIYADAKGLGHAERDMFTAIMRSHGVEDLHYWPNQPIDGMTGTRSEMRERLSSLFDSGESAFHHAEATTMLDLALGAGPLPRTLAELIHRTRPGITAGIYEAEGTEDALALHAQAKGFNAQQWQALYLRLRALHATLDQRLDAGPYSPRLNQVEAAWLSLPGTTAGQTASDAAAWILALIGELAGRNDGTPTLVILDEFSAVAARTGGAAAGLAERTRSAGVALIIGAQSVASLSDHAERLMANVGTDILHRVPLPQDLLELAGTTSVWEDLHQTSASGMRVATGGRRQQTYRVPPDLVRTLPAGQVVLIRHGHWAHVAVAPPGNA
jgi:DNA helicase HerA-like ATPase